MRKTLAYFIVVIQIVFVGLFGMIDSSAATTNEHDKGLSVVVTNKTSDVVIGGARVKINGNEGVTDEQGKVVFREIEQGVYEIGVFAKGFENYVKTVVIDSENTLKRVVLNPTRTCNISYYFSSPAEQIWVPVPVKWEGNSFDGLEVVSIIPEPDTLYTDNNGNRIAYWKNATGTTRKYSIEMNVELGSYKSYLSNYSPDYDKNTEAYRQYTADEKHTQSGNPKLIELAREITSGTTDPLEKAQKIAKWVKSNVSFGESSYGWLPDALSVMRYKKGHCGAFANLFVALCRAEGIPARNVSIFHNPFSPGNVFKSGSHSKTFNGHIIAEFYLEGNGWIPVETSMGLVGEIPYEMIVMAKGNIFVLERSNSQKKYLWFHLPAKGEKGQIEKTNIGVKCDY